MILSSNRQRFRGIGCPVVEDGPQHIHASSGQSNDDLMMSLALFAFAFVERGALGTAHRCECGLIEDPLESLVALLRSFEPAGFARLLQVGSQASGRNNASGDLKRTVGPATAMNSAVNSAPMPGRLRMRAASGCVVSLASMSRSSSTSRWRLRSASSASSLMRLAVNRSPGNAIVCLPAQAHYLCHELACKCLDFSRFQLSKNLVVGNNF